MSVIIECPFAGCDARIDVTADIDEMSRDLHPDSVPSLASTFRIPWLTHTIMCPKCGNCVGNLDISPGCFVELEGENRHLNSTKGKDKKMVHIGNRHRDMNRYLKKWSRWKREPCDSKAWVVHTKDGIYVVTSKWRLEEMQKASGYICAHDATLKNDP